MLKMTTVSYEIAVFENPKGKLEQAGRKSSENARDVSKNLGA